MKTWVLLVAAALVFSCTCRQELPPAAEEEPARPSVETGPLPQPEADLGPGQAEEPASEGGEKPGEPEGESPREPPGEQPGEPAEAVEVEPEPTAPAAVEESFVVTEEVYNRTFDEVEEFIRDLNEIIRRRDYQTWLTYLADNYIQRTSDAEYLREQSEKPLLKKNNIHLEGLRDYFEYVVAPSRSQATVDDIEFIDEDHVKVISSIRGTRSILYLLVRENRNWKIGVWD